MGLHPYGSLPDEAFWQNAVANMVSEDVDPVGTAKFKLALTDRIATAGSCFAQHITRQLRLSGYHPLVTENPHPMLPQHLADAFGYGLYTARYGNIYTSRQMIQMLMRSYGVFQPVEDVWLMDNLIVDPFRPAVQPGGFSSLREFRADQEQHFRAIRAAVETMDCLIFTLGLTECWRSRNDQSIYPICPGVSGGAFECEKYEFYNLSVADVIADLEDIVRFVNMRNSQAKFIFTVSPVPLTASASGHHVLTATTYSKSVLRVAAQDVASRLDNVAYFPSYEIIVGAHNRGAYFSQDLRTVTESGVAHVMRMFLRHYVSANGQTVGPTSSSASSYLASHEQFVKLICEEEALQVGDTQSSFRN